MELRLDRAETITARAARDVVILAASAAVTVTWSRYGPGERGPDPHVHREHTDAFYVLAGELEFELGPAGERVTVGAGGFAAVPPNVSHSFANAAGADAQYLNLHAPDAGFAAFMRGARDKVTVAWDSFATPPGGGLEPGAVVVTAADEAIKCALPELAVAEAAEPGDATLWFALPDGRALTIAAPGTP